MQSRKPNADGPSNARAAKESFDFAAEYRQSFHILWRIAVGVIGDAALAEDIVQEAAIVGLRKIDQFEPGTNFTAWMAKTVKYVALNHSRKEQKHRSRGASSALIEHLQEKPKPRPLADGIQPPEGSATFDEQLTRVLDEVGQTARTCLLLRTLDGLDYAKIALLLGIPQGTAMSHVHRARKLLRQRLAATHGPSAADRGNAR